MRLLSIDVRKITLSSIMGHAYVEFHISPRYFWHAIAYMSLHIDPYKILA